MNRYYLCGYHNELGHTQSIGRGLTDHVGRALLHIRTTGMPTIQEIESTLLATIRGRCGHHAATLNVMILSFQPIDDELRTTLLRDAAVYVIDRNVYGHLIIENASNFVLVGTG